MKGFDYNEYLNNVSKFSNILSKLLHALES